MAPRHEHRARWEITEVLDRTDLAALLDELTQPAGRLGPGRRWHCPLPDHDDHHASVTMFRDRHGHERWRCWSADHRGDAIDLVTITQGSTRADAIDWLATPRRHAPRPAPPTPATQTHPTGDGRGGDDEPARRPLRAGLRTCAAQPARPPGPRLATRTRVRRRHHRRQPARRRPRPAV